MRKGVSRLLRESEAILEVARQGGSDDCDLAVLVGFDGAIRIVQAAGWGLEPLRIDHGAREAYRVTRTGGRVAIEARSQGETCRIAADAPGRSVRSALADRPRYVTSAPEFKLVGSGPIC